MSQRKIPISPDEKRELHKFQTLTQPPRIGQCVQRFFYIQILSFPPSLIKRADAKALVPEVTGKTPEQMAAAQK
jgi:hypothetical protein